MPLSPGTKITGNRLLDELAKARIRYEEARRTHSGSVADVEAIERTLVVLERSEYWKKGC